MDQDEPKTYQEVVLSPDFEKWLEAMRSKMDSMSKNHWVFKKKTDMDGNVQTYKGRLVAKGFRQIHGVDYDETFSLVAMFKSIQILFAIAAYHDYEIWQMDIKTAFLNGKLEEDVYMTQPEGFVAPKNAGKEMCPSTPQERERMSQIPYASAIGSIMYAMICTRPDLSYALSMTSRYQPNPGEASEAAKEVVWINKFKSELGVVPTISDAVKLYCDNKLSHCASKGTQISSKIQTHS
ncbi:hypothetical protein V6N13_097471 [Hibiscus sabdariffa]